MNNLGHIYLVESNQGYGDNRHSAKYMMCHDEMPVYEMMVPLCYQITFNQPARAEIP